MDEKLIQPFDDQELAAAEGPEPTAILADAAFTIQALSPHRDCGPGVETCLDQDATFRAAATTICPPRAVLTDGEKKKPPELFVEHGIRPTVPAKSMTLLSSITTHSACLIGSVRCRPFLSVVSQGSSPLLPRSRGASELPPALGVRSL